VIRRSTRTPAFPVFVLLLIAAGAGSSLAVAEVGVALTSPAGAPAAGPYVLEIVDAPDPIGTVWHRLTSSPTHIVVNPEGEANGDGDPSFVFNSVSGLPIVAWSRNSGSGYDVVVSVFTGGAWTVPIVVAGSSANELDPNVFLDGAGNVHLVYWVDDGISRTVFHRQAPPDVSSWSAADQVSAPGETACRPAGVVHGGMVRVAYEVHPMGFGSSPRQVVLARYETGGIVAEIVATTNNTTNVFPEVHSQSGKLWLDWIDAHGATEFEGETAWTRLGSGGWEVVHYDPFANREERDFLVRREIKLEALAP